MMPHMPVKGDMMIPGVGMHRCASELFLLKRSLTGDGLRATLSYLKGLRPILQIHEVPSGAQAFDWTVPNLVNQ